ncbi:hypothetical protein HMPREF0293_1811 [Corynebacterium glucuronolyticum ATCC 51866]|uniref:Uncharacterized protein n=1 Tax=Corynebacterium glucuronolyticum ATCC 51866 TaxID=548478 RepID=A0ABP2DRL8_9CORY|nr:hypothetical protein HMPREF0293_1811 [Corynebacterium glucuronolyticum ATCC 51866]
MKKVLIPTFRGEFGGMCEVAHNNFFSFKFKQLMRPKISFTPINASEKACLNFMPYLYFDYKASFNNNATYPRKCPTRPSTN